MPHVVIVGTGFGGLQAARALRHAPVRVTVIDRSNSHLFQLLLHRVATADLSPAGRATQSEMGTGWLADLPAFLRPWRVWV
jgi:NADH dehydrogenase FAD-containing subunit